MPSDITPSVAEPVPDPFVRRSLAALLAGSLWFAALRGLHFDNLRLGLMNNYWATFYIMSYPDGFRRRALLGSLVRVLQPAGANILLVNAFALLVLGLLIAALALALFHLLAEH